MPCGALMTDCLGRTPLHLACVNVSCAAGAVELLVGACPMSASLQDTFGRTALHCLVSHNNNVSCSILEKMVKTSPKSATMHDNEGRLIRVCVCGPMLNVVHDSSLLFIERLPNYNRKLWRACDCSRAYYSLV